MEAMRIVICYIFYLRRHLDLRKLHESFPDLLLLDQVLLQSLDLELIVIF